ncbi:hypothetical protein KIPB_005808, partial [Kipferlia bialata]
AFSPYVLDYQLTVDGVDTVMMTEGVVSATIAADIVDIFGNPLSVTDVTQLMIGTGTECNLMYKYTAFPLDSVWDVSEVESREASYGTYSSVPCSVGTYAVEGSDNMVYRVEADVPLSVAGTVSAYFTFTFDSSVTVELDAGTVVTGTTSLVMSPSLVYGVVNDHTGDIDVVYAAMSTSVELGPLVGYRGYSPSSQTDSPSVYAVTPSVPSVTEHSDYTTYDMTGFPLVPPPVADPTMDYLGIYAGDYVSVYVSPKYPNGDPICSVIDWVEGATSVSDDLTLVAPTTVQICTSLRVGVTLYSEECTLITVADIVTAVVSTSRSDLISAVLGAVEPETELDPLLGWTYAGDGTFLGLVRHTAYGVVSDDPTVVPEVELTVGVRLLGEGEVLSEDDGGLSSHGTPEFHAVWPLLPSVPSAETSTFSIDVSTPVDPSTPLSIYAGASTIDVSTVLRDQYSNVCSVMSNRPPLMDEVASASLGPSVSVSTYRYTPSETEGESGTIGDTALSSLVLSSADALSDTKIPTSVLDYYTTVAADNGSLTVTGDLVLKAYMNAESFTDDLDADISSDVVSVLPGSADTSTSTFYIAQSGVAGAYIDIYTVLRDGYSNALLSVTSEVSSVSVLVDGVGATPVSSEAVDNDDLVPDSSATVVVHTILQIDTVGTYSVSVTYGGVALGAVDIDSDAVDLDSGTPWTTASASYVVYSSSVNAQMSTFCIGCES